jgi:hypothetical protein
VVCATDGQRCPKAFHAHYHIAARNMAVATMNWRVMGEFIMTKLPYVRTMFASCMLFQVIYVLCVVLWLAFPELKGHALLPAIFPNFTLLTIGRFIYGLIASGLYGWFVAIVFVFFYNLWPDLAAALFGQRAASR